jgi:hypothetical protein
MMQIYRLFPIYQFKENFLGKFYDGGGEMMENLGKKNYICLRINLAIPIAIGSEAAKLFFQLPPALAGDSKKDRKRALAKLYIFG